MRKYKNYELYGKVFTSRKKAIIYRNKWNENAKKQGVNLRYRILKKGKKYIVTQESRRIK